MPLRMGITINVVAIGDCECRSTTGAVINAITQWSMGITINAITTGGTVKTVAPQRDPSTPSQREAPSYHRGSHNQRHCAIGGAVNNITTKGNVYSVATGSCCEHHHATGNDINAMATGDPVDTVAMGGSGNVVAPCVAMSTQSPWEVSSKPSPQGAPSKHANVGTITMIY